MNSETPVVSDLQILPTIRMRVRESFRLWILQKYHTETAISKTEKRKHGKYRFNVRYQYYYNRILCFILRHFNSAGDKK